MKTTNKTTKTANVVRITGDVYDVTYSDGKGCDRYVGWRYIDTLLDKGYTVVVTSAAKPGVVEETIASR